MYIMRVHIYIYICNEQKFYIYYERKYSKVNMLIGKEFIGWIFESIFLHLEEVAFLLRIIFGYDGLGVTFGGSLSEE